jgi:hypothetical protein
LLGSAIQFYQKFDFGGNKDFFRILGFFEEKNLNPKKCILGVKIWKKWKIQICILDENEKFEDRKRAYFLRKMRGKGSFKHFFIVFTYPPQNLDLQCELNQMGIQPISSEYKNKELLRMVQRSWKQEFLFGH